MAGVSVTFESRDLNALASALKELSKWPSPELLDDFGRAGESATRKRIHEGGPAPDGEDWPKRHSLNESGKTLLNDHGDLFQSIEHDLVDDDTVIWGSNIEYARIHQLGGTIVPRHATALVFKTGKGKKKRTVVAYAVVMPPRPYLGFGYDERQGIDDVIDKALDEQFGRFMP